MEFLHITDYDDTISPTFTSDKEGYYEAYRNFINQNQNVSVVYSSARSIRDLKNIISEQRLPKPLFIIGNLGSEIFDYLNNREIDLWEKEVTETSWDTDKIKDLITNLELQEDDYQSKYTVGFFLKNAKQKTLDDIFQKLTANGLETDLIYTEDMYLNIMPKGVNKGSAGVKIASILGIPLSKVVISGDSENDTDMFFKDFGFKIIPKNATSLLIENTKDLKDIYFSEQKATFGVIDGLSKFINI